MSSAHNKIMRARSRALERLKMAHPEEFARMYDEERVEVGLKPLLPRKAERIAELERQLARLKGEQT